jgi:hypothetical protein
LLLPLAVAAEVILKRIKEENDTHTQGRDSPFTLRIVVPAIMIIHRLTSNTTIIRVAILITTLQLFTQCKQNYCRNIPVFTDLRLTENKL